MSYGPPCSSIYSPLVIDKGTTPAEPPVAPSLPTNAVVAIWFGFNGTISRKAVPIWPYGTVHEEEFMHPWPRQTSGINKMNKVNR